jgi:hypothetical protein
MSAFDRHSRIRDVVSDVADGRDRLFAHGYSLGEGYVDLLSQYQTLEDAEREGRLRDLEGLLAVLNSTNQK